MIRRMFTIASAASVLMCVAAILATVFSHDGNFEHWVYFATSDRRPSIVDGTIEFGTLGTPRAFDPTKHSRAGFSWSAPFEYGAAGRARKAHDTDDNFARQQLWNIAGVSETAGQIVPRWGWTRDRYNIYNVPTVVIPYRTVNVPSIYLAILFAITPAIWMRSRLLSNRRINLGMCPSCGYDLRASTDRCPECGTRITPEGGTIA